MDHSWTYHPGGLDWVLSWYPLFKSSDAESFEDEATIDFTKCHDRYEIYLFGC